MHLVCDLRIERRNQICAMNFMNGIDEVLVESIRKPNMSNAWIPIYLDHF